MTKNCQNLIKYRTAITLSMTLIIFWTTHSEAHNGRPHSSESSPGSLSGARNHSTEGVRLHRINIEYLRKIKPIFSRSCMDCHSSHTRYPWYYPIPGIKQAINRDITEARAHLDFTLDYPFRSHAGLLEDLNAIQESIQKGSMPPFKYRVFHPNSEATPAEKEAIFEWVNHAKKLLKDR